MVGLGLLATACADVAPSPSSARPATDRAAPASARGDPFAPLATRPWDPPSLEGDQCAPSPTAEIDARVAPASGTGPIVAILGATDGRFNITGATKSAFDRYQMKTLWVSTDPADAAVLIRVGFMDGNAKPGFMDGNVPDEHGMATQLRLGPSGSLTFGGGPMPQGWRAWSSGTLVADLGCYAFQIDTERATDHIVFEVIR